MAEIKLVFKPDVSEVSKAVKTIREDISKSLGNIKITVDSGAQQATKNLAANLRNVSDAAEAVRGTIKKTETEIDGALKKETELIRKATGEYEQYVKVYTKSGEKLTKTFIHNEEEKRKAAEKAEAAIRDARVKQAEAANRQIVKDEEEAQKRRSAAWNAHVENLNKEAKAQEQANRERQKAAETSVTLEKQYSDLIRQVQALKAQYPEGTFDAIEQQAREARDELRNLDRTTENYAEDVNRLGKAYQSLKRDISNTRSETDKLDKVTESLWMNIQKFSRWYVIGNVFTKILNSFREALSTMKEVDSELANIQKVTDRTDAEMQKLAESAYKAASAYGVTANAYLESAAEFAKAGFGDRAEELAEVAIKTQLVGDVSADVADKFLLASNAAWKMDGNLQLLNKTLDAANIIENNYATSIEKLAQGMPIVASVAANAGMTFEETIAALGTITSVTQETGTKSSTALRALILNIIGAVGEYEDGIEVTEESVKSLDGILQVYAKDAMEAAEAAGTVINPMEAIAALAKASEEGLVNQAELFEILSSLGGKLRTNQLISLVQNYDMFLEMLDKTKDSAGSADKEIGIMLDTWEAKTNILQNTWTEFVTDFVNTEGIKRALDGVIGLVRLLDTEVGRAIITSVGVTTVIFTIVGAVAKLKSSIAELNVTMLSNPVFLAIAGGTLAVAGIIKLADALTTSTKEYADAVKEAEDAYARTQGEIETLKGKSTELTDIERNRLTILQEQEKIEKERVRRAKADQYNNLYGEIDAYEQATALIEQYNAYKERLKNTTDAEVYQKTADGLNNVYSRILDTLSGLLDFREALGMLPPSGNEAIRVLNELFNSLQAEENAAEKAAEATGKLTNKLDETVPPLKTLTEILQEASDTATTYDSAIGGVVDAMADFGAGSIEVYNAMKSLEETIPGSTDKLYDFDTATVLAGDDIFTSKEAMLDFIDSSRQLEFSQAISELEDLAAGYWDVAGAALAAMANQQAAAQMAGVLAFTTGNSPQAASAGAQLADLQRQKAEWDAYIATLRGRKDYKSGGSSVSSRDYTPKSTAPERNTDAELERLKAIVSLEKAEVGFLQASGKSLEEINAKRKVIQEALHKQAEYMRSALALMDDTNSTEAERKAYEEDILALSTEWWSIQKSINDDIAKAEEERKKQLEEEAKLLEEQKKLQQEIFDTLRATVDDYYAKIISGKEKELSLEEKILAVQQAEAALANAQNERNVRYYNAAAGQWEWRANAKNVKSAQDSLKRAQDALNEYQRQEAWETFKSAWEYVAEQIKVGAMTFREAYDYMYEAMKDIQDKYGVDLGLTLEDSIGGFKTLNYGIDGLTQEVADSLGASVGILRERLEEYEDAVGDFRSSFDEATDKIKNGEMSIEDAYSYLRDRAREIADRYGIDMTGALDDAIAGMDKTSVSIDELWKAVILQLMKINSARWFDAGTEERALLHAQNEFLGGLIGATYDPNGYWSLNGSRLYESQKGASYSSSGASITSPSGAGSSGPSSAGGTDSSTPANTGGNSGGSGNPTHATALQNASTASELAALRQMEDAYARGDYETVRALDNKLRASGRFVSTTENGKPSGILYSVSGASNGSTILALNGSAAYSGVEAGTVLVDANGNYWKVGAGGALEKDIADNSASWYAKYQQAGRLDYAENYNPATVASLSDAMFAIYLNAAIENGQILGQTAEYYGKGLLTKEQILNSQAWKDAYVFDSGGILKGIGGIKATARDELILGPELTEKATSLAGDVNAMRTLDVLGGLLDIAAKSLPFAQSTVGSQYNGAVYQLGSVTLTEGQARSTSVYDLAQMASGLGIFNNRI